MAKETVKTTNNRGRRNEKTGVVTSNKMQKTITVKVFRTVRHARYGKYLSRSTVLKAHDENQTAKIGDTVLVAETRPLSKTKRWQLVRVIKNTTVAEGSLK